MAERKRIPRSYLWAVLFAVAIVLWIASGSLPRLFGDLSGSENADARPAEEQAAEPLFRVQVTTFTARGKPTELLVRGRTQASRRVEIRARTTGIVVELPLDEGAVAQEGTLLCRLDQGTRMAELAEARAMLASAEADFEAADTLADQQFGSELRRAQERAELDAARASVEKMETEIGYTRMNAPVEGVIEARAAELGSLLQVGSLCATIVDLDPMLVVVHVGERNIAPLDIGMPASARLVTGETVEGTISFIAPSADENTRTFQVEVEVENADLGLRDGVTAELGVQLPAISAHFLPASTLTLDDEGRIGVRVVDAEGIVHFRVVKILSDQRDGVWVSGLETNVDVITVGQDFVAADQRVEPVYAAQDAAQ